MKHMGYLYTCNNCKTHGVVLYSVTKKGGGNYNRPQRSYDASICAWCLKDLFKGRENDRYDSRVFGYLIGSIGHKVQAIEKKRAEIGDFAYGVESAHSYWADYKRLNKLMSERLETETEEYRAGFNSFSISLNKI